MITWKTIWIFLGLFLSVVSFFPLTNFTHWFFRGSDFIRLQLFALLLILLAVGIFSVRNSTLVEAVTISLITAALIYHFLTILPFLPKRKSDFGDFSYKIVVLNANVMQENKAYDKLVNVVNNLQPDIILTMETDSDWEKNMTEIDNKYKHSINVPKDNTYGMHLYTNLELKEFEVHYLISEEHPSIEATLVDKGNNEFVFWGIHPPPPSPTEKPTAKQKDAELLKVAKLSRRTDKPVVVSGDFNNVCWSKTSKLFSRISNLKDARLNKGFYSTFPADYWFLRFPIDLFYHSESITVSKLKVLPSIGSDHLPLVSEFHINHLSETSNEKMKPKLKEMTNEKIKEGKQAAKAEN